MTTLSFRAFLQDELAARCARNKRYSLRAFAMALGMDHSSLSQILRGKRALSPEAIRRLGRRMKLPKEDIEAFARYEELGVDAMRKRNARDAEIAVMRQLAHDAAELIEDPIHYNLLELVRGESFRADSRWLARVLDVTVDEVNVAVTRLVRLGLMEMSTKQSWHDRTGLPQLDRACFSRLVIRRLMERTKE